MANIFLAQDLPQTVVLHFDTVWSWQDLYTAVTDAHIMIETLAPAAMTFLVWHDVPLPYGNALLHFRNVFQSGPNNIDEVVMISGPNNMMFKLFETASQRFNPHLTPEHDITWFVSYEEALNYLVGQRSA